MKLKLQFTLFFIILVTSLYSQEYKIKVDQDGVKTFREGTLLIKEGMSFLTVKGNAYEMGLQYGVLMNDQLLGIDNAVENFINTYVGNGFKVWIAKLIFNSKIRKLEKRMPKEYLLELKGMADGSDLKLKEIKILAYLPELLDLGCSSFILRNENGIVHGHNMDFPGIESLIPFSIIVNYHKENKIPVTLYTFAGYPGLIITGMNHHGLSMSEDSNYTCVENGKKKSDYNKDMPVRYKMRQILENCDVLDDVDHNFKGYSAHAHFIIIGSKKDKSGAVYELTRDEIIKNEMTNDFLCITNLSLSDKGRYLYSPISEHATSSISREEKLIELNNRFNNEDLIDKSYHLLSNTEFYKLSYAPFFNNSINNASTGHSCIMNNMKNEIYFSYGENFAALNTYLYYNVLNGDVKVYKKKQEMPKKEEYEKRLKYYEWFNQNFKSNSNLEKEDCQRIIEKAKGYNFDKYYEAFELSYFYEKAGDYENALKYADIYTTEMPDFHHSYYNKHFVMKANSDYMGAIVALEKMLQTSTINPHYEYLANLNMIKMYDKLLDEKFDQMYLDKIRSLAKKVRSDVNSYFIDETTQKELQIIEEIEMKYIEKN